MKPLEDQLHRALQRLDPPEGFTDRVMARVKQQAAPKAGIAWLRPFRFLSQAGWPDAWQGHRAVLGLLATAAVLLLTVSALVWRQHRLREERRQGELARAQVMEALHITGAKLHRVRTRVREASRDGVRVPDRDRGRPGKPEAMIDARVPILD